MPEGETALILDVEAAAKRLRVDRGAVERCLQNGALCGFRDYNGEWKVVLRGGSVEQPVAREQPQPRQADETAAEGRELTQRIDRMLESIEDWRRHAEGERPAAADQASPEADRDHVLCELARQLVRLSEACLAAGSAGRTTEGEASVLERLERHEQEIKDLRETALYIRDFLTRHWPG